MEALHEPVHHQRERVPEKDYQAAGDRQADREQGSVGRSPQYQILLASQIPAIEARLDSAPSNPLTIVDVLRFVRIPDGPSSAHGPV